MNSQFYSKQFYDYHWSEIKLSAEIMVPIINDLVKPKSVIDLGCGRGDFLKTFFDLGVKDILGVDGLYAKEALVFPKKYFMPMDLEKPFRLNRKFDLAMSLEVAEHLSPFKAKTFIKSLTSLSSFVLFSAAVPGQGGTNHINEQWIDYWVNLFEHFGYVPVDAIRKRIWHNKKIEPWYRQNTIIFCEKNFLNKNKILADEEKNTSKEFLSVIHPEIYEVCYKSIKKSLFSRVVNKTKKVLGIIT